MIANKLTLFESRVCPITGNRMPAGSTGYSVPYTLAGRRTILIAAVQPTSQQVRTYEATLKRLNPQGLLTQQHKMTHPGPGCCCPITGRWMAPGAEVWRTWFDVPEGHWGVLISARRPQDREIHHYVSGLQQ